MVLIASQSDSTHLFSGAAGFLVMWCTPLANAIVVGANPGCGGWVIEMAFVQPPSAQTICWALAIKPTPVNKLLTPHHSRALRPSFDANGLHCARR
jgi:hypothetical protein